MYNEKQKFTKLTLEQPDLKVIWEIPYDDVSGDDMMQAIRTIMIGMTFNEHTIESSMARYLQDHAYDHYNVTEIDNNIEKADYEEVEDDDKENDLDKNGNWKPHYYA